MAGRIPGIHSTTRRLVCFRRRGAVSAIPLTGLRGNSPLGFLAALGVLRLCTEHLMLDCKLSWQDPESASTTEGFWHANLDVEEIKGEQLFTQLIQILRNRTGASEFLQDESRRYRLDALGEAPALLRRILLSNSFHAAMLDRCPDLTSADCVLTDPRLAEVAELVRLATEDLGE